MSRMLGVALAAGLALLPSTAFATESVRGTVQSVDVVTGVFTIKTEGQEARELRFAVAESLDFDELGLETGEQLSVDYDPNECGADNECVSTATKVERKS